MGMVRGGKMGVGADCEEDLDGRVRMQCAHVYFLAVDAK